MRRAPGFVEAWSAGLRRLQQGGPLPPLLVIAGESAHPKERLIAAAAARAEGAVETFATRPGEGDKPALQRLVDQWTTATLFGGRQLLVARDVGPLMKAGGTRRFEELLSGGALPHDLLVTLPALDGRSKLAKLLKSQDGLIALPVMRDSPPPWHAGGPFLETDLNQWVVAEAREQGLSVDLAAADELTRRIGNEPGRLTQRLGQLAVLLGEGTRLTREVVAEHVPHSSVRLLGLYDDALRGGREREALELVDRMEHEGVHDPFGRLVAGPLVTETVLRTLTSQLARTLEAHERLTPALHAALRAKPWERSSADSAALDDVLGKGGRRVFLERDLRTTRPAGVRAAFRVAVAGLRALRDGHGVSLHAQTVRLARAHAGRPAPETPAW